MAKEIVDFENLDKFATKISKHCKENTYILLKGDLGAGKTTFTKSLLKALGVEENVKSPTFNILNQYQSSSLNINHMDAYRLTEEEDLGLYLEVFQNSLNIIEWYENLKLNWKDDFKNVIFISIEYLDEYQRSISYDIKKRR